MAHKLSMFYEHFAQILEKSRDAGRNAKILAMIATDIRLKSVLDRQEMWLVSRRKISD